MILLSIICSPLWALEQVTLQLNWKHQFQFAGYYAAIEKGYFRDAGYEVTLVEAGALNDPIAAVLKGEALFGVGASELALHRARGEPVVALAAILQHSPLVLLANSKVANNVHALSGRAHHDCGGGRHCRDRHHGARSGAPAGHLCAPHRAQCHAREAH